MLCQITYGWARAWSESFAGLSLSLSCVVVSPYEPAPHTTTPITAGDMKVPNTVQPLTNNSFFFLFSKKTLDLNKYKTYQICFLLASGF